MGKKLLASILLVTCFVVAISGCTNIGTPQNKTFNNSGISFQYPGNWSDNVNITWSSGDNIQNESIGGLGNGNVTLGVLYINESQVPAFKSFDISALANLAVQSWKTGANGNNTNILSQTSRQLNNITLDEIIYTTPDPATNNLYKYYYVITGEKGKSVYILRFGAPEADFSKYFSQFQSIVNSIKIK